MRRVFALTRLVRYVNFSMAIAGLLAGAAVFIGLTPALGWACACGCGVFEVATPSLLPKGAGGTVWTEWDYMDQDIDWHATTPASAGQNNDKKLETNFVTVGAQYMFNRSWGAMLEVPYWERNYRGAYVGNNADIQEFDMNSIGDIRIMGMWTGLSEDMSTGFLGGFKLPSGDWHYPPYDRDTQIGTGSTDLLMGGYKIGHSPFTVMERPFGWFLQGLYDIPFAYQDHYKPGREFDGALGTFYNFGAVGPLKELAPMLSILGSDRSRDRGTNASPNDTGYDKVAIAPGIETTIDVLRFYADVEVPIFQNLNGFQLVAPFATKLIVSYSF
ncbi:MAG: hypothetical protein ACREQI_10050 [Candidatus Binataceae bacterium]